MRFNIDPKTRAIDNNYSKLGIQGENKVEIVEFVAPKIVGQVDLSDNSVQCLLSANSPSGGTFAKVLPITVEQDQAIVKWEVGLQETSEVGYLKIALRFSNAFDNLLKTLPTTFEVMETITVESEQPILFSSRNKVEVEHEKSVPYFDGYFNGIDYQAATFAVVPESEVINVIENKLIIPAKLQNIAVQNDNESKIVNIIMPRYYQSEDLSKYPIKLHLQVSDGGSEWVPFTPVIVGNNLKLEWTVQRPHTSYAGKLRMQIEVGDITTDTFFKQTEIAEVNILNSLDGDTPIVPVLPPEFLEYLKQIEAVKQEAVVAKDTAVTKADEANASATDSALSAESSAENAAKSEIYAKKSPYVGADGYWYVFDFDKGEFVKNVYAGGRKLNGAFDTLEELKATYPNGDGNHEYRVGDLIYSWDGTSWNATSGTSDYADIANTPEIDNVKLKAGNNTRAELKIAKDVNAFIPCNAVYDEALKRHTLTPMQAGIVLPEVFTVRFMATEGFKTGDKVYLNGVEYTPAYNDSDDPVETGVWMLGAVVDLPCSTLDKKVFVGAGLPSIHAELNSLKKNKLDLPIKGTWIPTAISGVIISDIVVAKWIKVGSCVQAELECNLKRSGNEIITIGGLPFASSQKGICIANAWRLPLIQNAVLAPGYVTGTAARLCYWRTSDQMMYDLSGGVVNTDNPGFVRLFFNYEAVYE